MADPAHETPARPLDIIVVGAGIGGLTAALALRQQGHNVIVLETSKFSNETGAAIHIAPNCCGLLRRLGVRLEKVGANPCNGLRFYNALGQRVQDLHLTEQNKMWQHPWLMVHRAHLHSTIREAAVNADGKGKPCLLKLSSRVTRVDPDSATVTLASGEVVNGDLVLGADGVHSICRQAIPGTEKHKPFDSGHSAFRFMVPIAELMMDSVTAPLVGPQGCLSMNIVEDRRIVYYPCVDNTLMNFLLIHPSGESRADGADWNQKGDKQQMLSIASVYSHDFKALLQKAPEDTLKVWALLDMDVLDTWVEGHLALLGDAAHPFLPHQAQGAAQAIEDAVSLAALLPIGTLHSEIPSRLELYLQCRKPRADAIQEFTRLSGMPQAEMTRRGLSYDPIKFSQFNFSHDEWDSSRAALAKHIRLQHPYRFRQPVSFGPSPGPRQPQNLLRGTADQSAEYQVVHSIRFTTSATHLRTLFPTEQFSFASPGTVAQASVVCCSLREMAWLGGLGYERCGLYIHGVTYTKRNGETIQGTFVPVLFENLADAVVSGREELGAPKCGCDIAIWGEEAQEGVEVEMAWRGRRFGSLRFKGLTETAEASVPPKPKDEGLLAYRYIPAVGEPGKADAEYAVFDPFPATKSELANDPPEQRKALWAKKATVLWEPRDWAQLPTIHHIVAGLAEAPVFEVLEASIETVRGVSDLGGARRIE